MSASTRVIQIQMKNVQLDLTIKRKEPLLFTKYSFWLKNT